MIFMAVKEPSLLECIVDAVHVHIVTAGGAFDTCFVCSYIAADLQYVSDVHSIWLYTRDRSTTIYVRLYDCADGLRLHARDLLHGTLAAVVSRNACCAAARLRRTDDRRATILRRNIVFRRRTAGHVRRLDNDLSVMAAWARSPVLSASSDRRGWSSHICPVTPPTTFG